MHIGSYTDFFAGRNHAYNRGCIFRDPGKALQPNYLLLPVGYNSRASTVVVSGTGVHRLLGQYLASPSDTIPTFGPCRRLDFELELGALLCKSSSLSQPIDVNQAEQFTYGYVLLNDWSARDIQAWEAVPLGPFNSKIFATLISPWVILKDALEPFRVPSMLNETKLHRYLQERQKENVYAIELEADLKSQSDVSIAEYSIYKNWANLFILPAKAGNSAVSTRTNGRNLVFSFPQMLAHHTIGGCRMEVGDLLGSGTISGTQPGTLGSLLENLNGGKTEYEFSANIKRKFLEDGNSVIIKGRCGHKEVGIVGFGEC